MLYQDAAAEIRRLNKGTRPLFRSKNAVYSLALWLAAVLTDIPLIPTAKETQDVDDFYSAGRRENY